MVSVVVEDTKDRVLKLPPEAKEKNTKSNDREELARERERTW